MYVFYEETLTQADGCKKPFSFLDCAIFDILLLFLLSFIICFCPFSSDSVLSLPLLQSRSWAGTEAKLAIFYLCMNINSISFSSSFSCFQSSYSNNPMLDRMKEYLGLSFFFLFVFYKEKAVRNLVIIFCVRGLFSSKMRSYQLCSFVLPYKV